MQAREHAAMSKQHLTKYIETKNWVRRMFKDPELDANNLTPTQVRELLDQIETDLSPEILTCDGELRGAKLRSKQNMLLGAQKELEKMVQPA
jgi:hypothetical protein